MLQQLKKHATILMLLVCGLGYIVSCTHDNEIFPEPVNNNPVVERGKNIHLPGNMTVTNPTEWKFDKTHSSVLWSTTYVGASGLLTGRFNQFGPHDVLNSELQNYNTTGQPLKDTSWAFYESEPAKTYFNGYVQINTSNTGEPGRDAGCNLGAMGTTAIVTGVQNLTVTNIARIKSTSVEFDPVSSDYLVKFNFIWQGKLAEPATKSLVGRLKYIPKSTIAAAVPYDVFGLVFSFQFNCRDFGITSTSVSDKIDVTINANFHNK